MPGILGALWDATVGQLTNPASAGPAPLTNDDLVPLVQGLKYEARLIDDVFNEADGLNATTVVVATDVGAQLRKVAQADRFAIEHTYKTVLPNSLSWLRGDVVLHLIDPLRKRVKRVEGQATSFAKWETDIKLWRSRRVDPTLQAYDGFAKWFNEWPLNALNVLHGWLTTPGKFSDFAVPIIARPLVAYVAADDHQQLLDDLLQSLVVASPDRYRYVVAAFEMMLDQEWP